MQIKVANKKKKRKCVSNFPFREHERMRIAAINTGIRELNNRKNVTVDKSELFNLPSKEVQGQSKLSLS